MTAAATPRAKKGRAARPAPDAPQDAAADLAASDTSGPQHPVPAAPAQAVPVAADSAVKAPTDGMDAPSSEVASAGEFAPIPTTEPAAAVVVELSQSEMAAMFVAACVDREDCDIVLEVTPGISLWRGGRHFTAGRVERIAGHELTLETLQRILDEPRFAIGFVVA